MVSLSFSSSWAFFSDLQLNNLDDDGDEREQLQGIYRESVRQIFSKVDFALSSDKKHFKSREVAASESRDYKGIQVNFASLATSAGLKGSRSKKKQRHQRVTEGGKEATTDNFDHSTVNYLKKSQQLSQRNPNHRKFPASSPYQHVQMGDSKQNRCKS